MDMPPAAPLSGALPMPPDMGMPDAPSVHGWFMVGDHPLYFSHLPASMSPHNYQVLLATTLSKAGADPIAAFVNDRNTSGTTIYTFKPDSLFTLTEFVSKDPAHPPLRAFTGTIFRNNFFKNEGIEVMTDVSVTITHVLCFHKFTAATSALPSLEYRLFGKPDMLFAAHALSRPPDYDQILSVKIANYTFTEHELEQTLTLAIPGRQNTIANRLAAQQQVRGETHAPKVHSLQIAVESELYFEDQFLKG